MPAVMKKVTDSHRQVSGILVSTLPYEKISVFVDAATRDAVGGHTPTTILREGLVLVKITSGASAGKYKHFDSGASDGSEESDTAVVLTADHEIDTTNGGLVSAYFKATLWRGKLLVGSGFDPSACQRLAYRDDMQEGF